MSDSARLQANVRTFYLFRFLANLQLWLPIWVLYLQRERGLTIGQITALDAPFWLVVVAAQLPTGVFADRFGRRMSLVVGSVLYAFAMVGFGLATGYPLILASYLLWAVALAFQSGADLALLYDNLVAMGRGDDYQRAAGRAFGVTAASGVVALIAGAKLADLTRLDVPILVSAGICLVTAVAAWTFHEPARTRHQSGGMLRSVARSARTVWHDPRLRYMLGFSAVVQAASFAPIIFVQPFLQKYGAPVSAYGLLQSPARLCSIVAALYAYRLAHRIGERRLLLAVPLWLFGCLLVLAAIDSPYAFVAFPLLQLGFSVSNPLLSDYVNRYIPAAERATVLSIGQLLASLMLVGFEPLLGASAQAYGITAAFGTAAAAVAIGSAITVLPWLRAIRSDPQIAAGRSGIGEAETP